MIHGDTLWFVQWDKRPDQKLQMLLLQRNCKSINDTSQNLQQFANTIMSLRLIYESVEDIGYRTSNKLSMRHEFTINTMKDSFQIVSFTWILTIE